MNEKRKKREEQSGAGIGTPIGEKGVSGNDAGTNKQGDAAQVADEVKEEITFRFHIPTQTYGFLELEGGIGAIKEAEVLYNRYAEYPLKFSKGIFEEFETFTGEKIRYNEATHEYTDTLGNKLISGSQYKKSLEKPFPMEEILPKMEKKYGVPAQTIKEMWALNSQTSQLFGKALHSAMEQWFVHKNNGTEKDYHIPKHPFLKEAVMTFPLKEANAVAEKLISAVGAGMVGRIDLLTITGEKEGVVEDYKSDADIGKSVDGHFNQLSFYAEILKEHGWKIPMVRVWNYAGNGWEKFESLPLEVIIKK